VSAIRGHFQAIQFNVEHHNAQCKLTVSAGDAFDLALPSTGDSMQMVAMEPLSGPHV